jgi:peptide-methionine (S)-S-oxide reductase
MHYLTGLAFLLILFRNRRDYFMLFTLNNNQLELPDQQSALPDRVESVQFTNSHFVSGREITEPIPEGIEKAVFGLGCFWGAERLFWEQSGVYSTAAGYAGGITKNPSYEDVCSGGTGHTEVVLVFFDPRLCSFDSLLKTFWESHNPTQGMRQGNDQGSQYRSAIYTLNEQQERQAKDAQQQYQEALSEKGFSIITTEVKPLQAFFYAEDYHQQYLAKNPLGYCGLAGTGASYQRKIGDE